MCLCAELAVLTASLETEKKNHGMYQYEPQNSLPFIFDEVYTLLALDWTLLCLSYGSRPGPENMFQIVHFDHLVK